MPIDRQEDHPLQPDGFALVFDQLRPQVQDDDAQAVDDVEQHAEEDHDLEDPVFVNEI